MEVEVMSRSEAVKHRPAVPTCCISIVDPFARDANLRYYGMRLRLRFYDAVVGELLINEKEAEDIRAFARYSIQAGTPRMVIHCEAGRCRSAAVAAALETLFPNDVVWVNRDATLWTPEGHVSRFDPNPLVYRMVAGRELGDWKKRPA